MKRTTLTNGRIALIFAVILSAASMISGCGGGGGGTTSTSTTGNGGTTTPVVVQTQFPVEGVVYSLPATYINSAQVELLRSGVAIATTTTNASGVYQFNDVATGTAYAMKVSGTALTAPYFITKTAGFAVTATTTFPISVTLAARTVNAEAVNGNDFSEHFKGANYQLVCASTGYDKQQLALDNTGVFTDVPLANDCTLSVTNLGTTTPSMSLDTLPLTVAVTGDGLTLTVYADKPACTADTQCPAPIGQAAACYNPGHSNAECGGKDLPKKSGQNTLKK